MNKINDKGFTLVELLAVIVILALVIVIVATKGFGAFDNAKDKITSMNEDAIKEAAEIVKLDIEHCDDSNDDLLSMFGVSNCNDLYTKLLTGVTITLDSLMEKEYITGDGINDIKKQKIYSIKYQKVGEDISIVEITNEEKKATLLKRNGSSSTEKYYTYKSYIKKIKFVDYVDIEGKTYWDVTDTSGALSNTKIYAWLENIEGGYYELYFGSEAKIHAPKNLSYFFQDFSIVENITFSNFDTSNTTNMTWMFGGCSSLQNLDLSVFNTNNVTSMYTMFYNCNSLKSLNVSSFNVEKVTNMDWMFSGCKSLTELDISNFKTTEKLVSVQYMFQTCSNLTYLDLFDFKTTSSTNINGMLNGTTKLNSICVDQTKANEIYNLVNTKGISIVCN